MRRDGLPIPLQRKVFVVSDEDLASLEVADKTAPVVKQEGYAVPAVARRGNDLSVDPHTAEKGSAVRTGDNGRFTVPDRRKAVLSGIGGGPVLLTPFRPIWYTMTGRTLRRSASID